EAAGAAVAIVSRGDKAVFGTGQSFSGASGTSSGAPQNVYGTGKNASGGSRTMSGELVFHFLWPEKNSVITGNDASLTAAVSYETFTGLLTGDISSDMEGAIDFPDHITWLKTAHHGSKYSTSRKFLQKTAPLTATAGAGRRNVYGHPAEETRERFRDAGTAFFCTADCGAVTVTFRNDTVQVKTFLDNKAGK
ncbi:MAG: hypothetical protein IJL98_09005, partial [Lachnospiraceae bacterium]|nr:hypothetical protein [Lachnospiraceae bacterium]